MRTLVRFFKDDSGASAAEYAVLLALICILLIAAATTLGQEISAVFNTVTTALQAAA